METHLNVLIVEDEIIIAESLKLMLQKLGHAVTGTCTNFDQFNKYIQQMTADLVLLDINLKEARGGIEISEICHKQGVPFIFVTSYADESTLNKALKFEPLGYMLKPFTERELKKTLEIARFKITKHNDILNIKDGHSYVKLKCKDILWLKADNVYTEIQLEGKKYLYRNSLSEMIKQLPQSGFFRVHRSYIVNLEKVEKIGSDYVLIHQEHIPLSRSKKPELIERIA